MIPQADYKLSNKTARVPEEVHTWWIFGWNIGKKAAGQVVTVAVVVMSMMLSWHWYSARYDCDEWSEQEVVQTYMNTHSQSDLSLHEKQNDNKSKQNDNTCQAVRHKHVRKQSRACVLASPPSSAHRGATILLAHCIVWRQEGVTDLGDLRYAPRPIVLVEVYRVSAEMHKEQDWTQRAAMRR